MNTENKLKYLFKICKSETVCLGFWLEKSGISYSLQERYIKSGWLEPVGRGAFKKPDEQINWQGGLYALQFQAGLPLHAGALTALSLQGYAHYLRPGREQVFLFSPSKTTIPKWFKNYNWKSRVEQVKTSFLETDSGIIEHEERNFSIKISSPERAMLECLYLAPSKMDLVECYQLMEGLTNLRPALLQKLLENCKSIKVKRLFLYLSKKINHQWMNFIDQSKIYLGKGDRAIAEGGVYIPEFKIVVPQELTEL